MNSNISLTLVLIQEMPFGSAGVKRPKMLKRKVMFVKNKNIKKNCRERLGLIMLDRNSMFDKFVEKGIDS